MGQGYELPFNQTKKLFELQAGHGEDRRAQVQTHVKHDNQAVNMEKRQDAQQGVVLMKVSQTVHLAHVRDQVVVREHHTFRQTRGAAGIWQRYQIFKRIDLNARHIAVTFQERIEWSGTGILAKDE